MDEETAQASIILSVLIKLVQFIKSWEKMLKFAMKNVENATWPYWPELCWSYMNVM